MKKTIFHFAVIIVLLSSVIIPSNSAYCSDWENSGFRVNHGPILFTGNRLNNTDITFSRLYFSGNARPGYLQGCLKLILPDGDTALQNYWVNMSEANRSMEPSVFNLIDADYLTIGGFHANFKKIKYFIGEFVDTNSHKAVAFEYSSELTDTDQSGAFHNSYLMTENRYDLFASYYKDNTTENLVFSRSNGSYLYEIRSIETGKPVGIRYYSLTNQKEYKMFFK
jgi:hypothetical protein